MDFDSFWRDFDLFLIDFDPFSTKSSKMVEIHQKGRGSSKMTILLTISIDFDQFSLILTFWIKFKCFLSKVKLVSIKIRHVLIELVATM